MRSGILTSAMVGRISSFQVLIIAGTVPRLPMSLGQQRDGIANFGVVIVIPVHGNSYMDPRSALSSMGIDGRKCLPVKRIDLRWERSKA